jgi:hypothetical protein
MKLTDEEKRMLNGEHGEAARFSMEILTKIGESYGAERLVEVASVHAAAAYPELLASVEMMEGFADKGGKFKVPTTVDPAHQPCHFGRWPDLPEPPEYLEKARRIVLAIEKMGVIPNWSCIPYFQGNAPRFGQHVAWVESSAICFANSVLGARTNRLTMGLDVAAAITGRIPYFGLHLDENRKGNALVKIEYVPQNLSDYGTVGYLIGKYLSDKVPVIEGLPPDTTANQLKMLGAAAAGRGAIALYHAVGLTPEAKTKEQAFGGRKADVEIKIGTPEIVEILGEINTAKNDRFDAVLLGCPHPNLEEIRDLASLLHGKRIKPGIKFWIFISFDVLDMARKMGYAGIIEEAGAQFIEGDCIMFFAIKDWGWKTVVTDSAKYANILPSEPTCVNVIYRDTAGCVALVTI